VDVLYPVRGFKRFVDSEDGYEFRYDGLLLCLFIYLFIYYVFILS